MSDSNSTFMDGLLDGQFLLEEIDDFVSRWHKSSEDSLSLHDFLGMTWEEYSLWAGNPDTLSDIADARNRGIPLREAVNDNIASSLKLAARSDKASKIADLQRWIEQQDSSHP